MLYRPIRAGFEPFRACGRLHTFGHLGIGWHRFGVKRISFAMPDPRCGSKPARDHLTRWPHHRRAEFFALVPCSHAHFFFFEAARKGGTLEVKNLAEEGGKLFRPKVGRTCAVD